MPTDPIVPKLRQVVLDSEHPRRLAEFYRELFGLRYRAGHEPPAPGQPDPDGDDWLNLRDERGLHLAVQKTDRLPRPTWPDSSVPQMLHLDSSVPDADLLRAARERALALGATELADRFDDPEEPLYVFARSRRPPVLHLRRP